MIFRAKFGREVSASGVQGQTGLCVECRSILYHPTYECIYFYIEDQFDWKPFYRSCGHHYVRSDVAEKLVKAKVTGLELVQIELEIKVPQKSEERWEYYAMKPISVLETEFCQEEWKIDCETCGGIRQRIFGNVRRPIQVLWESWDGSDVVHPRQLPYCLLFSRRMIDLFRANNWHHDIVKARRGDNWDHVAFGNDRFPGKQVRDIDSDSWYEETLAVLKERFPDIRHEPDSPPAPGLPAPIPAFITPLPEAKASKHESPKPSIPKLIEEKIFDGVYLDQDDPGLFVIADCPPLGVLRINIASKAIGIKLVSGEPNERGMFRPRLEAELEPKASKATLRALGQLWERWEVLWPLLHTEILRLRESYGREEAVTAENAIITITPPGDHTEFKSTDWSFVLEITPQDGYYDAQFQLDGTITDSGATF